VEEGQIFHHKEYLSQMLTISKAERPDFPPKIVLNNTWEGYLEG
jgi:hypothetical protein